jgi:hypothetical protein
VQRLILLLKVPFDRLALRSQARNGEIFNPSPEAVRCLGGAFGGWVAPGAGAGGADGADLEPVLGAAGQAGDGAARGFADVALRPGSAGRGGLLGDVGLDAAPEGVPGEVHGAFEAFRARPANFSRLASPAPGLASGGSQGAGFRECRFDGFQFHRR